MSELNNLEKANLIKDNWIKQRNAKGRFMAIITSVKELNNPTFIKESNNLAFVKELINLIAIKELIILAFIKKVAQVKETTIGEISKHVPKRN